MASPRATGCRLTAEFFGIGPFWHAERTAEAARRPHLLIAQSRIHDLQSLVKWHLTTFVRKGCGVETRTLAENQLELRCVRWGAHILFAVFFAGWILGCRFIPSPSPSDTAVEIARRFAENRAGIQIGATLMLLSMAFWAVWGAVVASWTRRARGGGRTLTYAQIVCMSVSEVVGVLCTSFWAIAAYRPGNIDPQITATLNDIAFMFFLLPWGPFSMWCLTVAVTVFRDRRMDDSEREFPRWVGYVSLLTAFLFAPAMLVLFFKHTAYGFDGLLGMWIPLLIFFVWVEAVSWSLIDRLKAERVRLLINADSAAPQLDTELAYA